MSAIDNSTVSIKNNTTNSYTIGKKSIEGKVSFKINGKEVKAGDKLQEKQELICTVKSSGGTKGDATGTITLDFVSNDNNVAGTASIQYEFLTSDPFGSGTVRIKTTAVHPLWIAKVNPSNSSGKSYIKCVIPSKGQFADD